MRIFCAVLLFFATVSTTLAQDLELSVFASPASGLWLDDEVLVSTTVRNRGPGAAGTSSAWFFGEDGEIFYFQFVGSESPECVLEALDFNPPIFNFMWRFPALGAGESQTCVVRLRVFNVPDDATARLEGTLQPPAGDPDSGNNEAVLGLSFGTVVPAATRTIPATSEIALGLIAAGTLAFGLLALASKRARKHVIHCLLVLAGGWAGGLSAASPPPLFIKIFDAAANPPPRVLAEYPVEVNFAPLDQNTDAINLVLPGSEHLNYTATRTHHETRAGGGYHWIGKTSEHDVVLSVDGQRITGFLRGSQQTFAITTRSVAGGIQHSLSLVDSAAFPPDLVVGAGGSSKAARSSADGAKANLPDFPDAQCFGAVDEPIDVLVVYSPGALAKAGGDVQVLRNQVANAEAKANVTLVNSDVPARIRVIAVEPAPISLIEVGTSVDLENARDDEQLQQLRRLRKADASVFLVGSGAGYCGVTRAQRRAGDFFFGMGYDFYDSAVLVLVHDCMVLENDLSHELGHIVGLDHNPQNAIGTDSTNILPYAFGHFVNKFFRDDMSSAAYCSNGCQRKMFFSDPTMFSDGYPRGTASRNNAQTYRRMYRCTNTLADFIFVDNFE